MGKALRQGDTESFLLEYDKVLHDLDAEGCNSPAVQVIQIYFISCMFSYS